MILLALLGRDALSIHKGINTYKYCHDESCMCEIRVSVDAPAVYPAEQVFPINCLMTLFKIFRLSLVYPCFLGRT